MKTKYKMIAIDIDGTLLTPEKKIHIQTKEDIKEAYNKGVIICICTGRAYPAAKRYVDELDLQIPLILYNGSRIISRDGKEIIFNKTIDKEISNSVFDIINMNDGTCCFWKDDALYFNKNNDKKHQYFFERKISAFFIPYIFSNTFYHIIEYCILILFRP